MLARGSRIGSYEVLEPIGAGGSGEVYRARDARLGRDVAIKILAERSRMDSRGLRRLEREAQVLASLNHPNIATLHAIEPFADTQALVLELVEGETLAECLSHGALALPLAMGIALQMAAALGAAHEQGVVHRDLKPSNVKLRPDGTVKLLDFGLAKVCEEAAVAHPGDVTMTMLGEAGQIMGTPAYMSPEQARGLPVDKRADIWAFGCLLFEMLAGVGAFAAEHTSDVLARIIEREPDFDLLPPTTPRAVRNLLRRCLRKDPRERLRDIGDARLYLEEAGSGDTGQIGAWVSAHRWPRRRALVLAVLALAGVVAVGAGMLPLRRPVAAAAAPRPVARFAIPVGIATSFYARALAIAPDGSRIAYISSRGLVVRPRDSLQSLEITGRGMSGMGAPFFSPDGQWIAYTDGQSLLKVPSAGGTPIEITDSGSAALGSWGEQGIVFGTMTGLFVASPQGGPATRLAAEFGPQEQPVFPQTLPGGVVLYTVLPGRTNTPSDTVDSPDATLELFDPRTGKRRQLLRGAARATYLPTGHLVYVAGSNLHAVAFDLDRLAMVGEPVAVISGVSNMDYAVADDGTLAYHAGPAARESTLVWVDRQGREEPLDAPPRDYTYARLSPDGSRVALDMQGIEGRDIYLWDMRTRKLERFSIDPTGNPLMAWRADGRALAYGTGRFGATSPVLQTMDGKGEPQRLMHNERLRIPIAYDRQGRLLVSGDVPGRGRDIFAVSMDGSGHEEPILHSAGNDLNGEVSPDGRWIAYDSDETGQYEIHVRPYPDAYSGRSWQITSDGGRHPVWSPDGRQIYFRDFDGAMWSIPVQVRPDFAPGTPERLFANAAYSHGARIMSGRHYDLAPDGRRFLMIKREPVPAGDDQGLVVVLNWFEELRRLVPIAARPAGG